MSLFVPRRRFDESRREMIDLPDADPELLRGELRNLRRINARIGSLRSVRDAVMSLVAGTDPRRTVELLDLATGSADHPASLVDAFRKAGQRVSITAVDKNPIMLEAARAFAGHVPEIRFDQQDILALPYLNRSFDVAMCSLALHHFSRAHAVTILREMNRLSRVGFVVHDLARSYPAAIATWAFTHVMTTNIMTRRDGVASIMNAFTTEELREMAGEAGVGETAVWQAGRFRLMALHRSTGT